MDFNSIEELKEIGFTGFQRIGDLFINSSLIPKIKGVCLVLEMDGKPAEYLSIGKGGHFKRKDPKISINELKINWIVNSIVVYIGKTGKDGSGVTLHSRIKQFLGFGQGRNIGHWGGMLIWQLKSPTDLVVCWKELPSDDP